MSISFSDPAVRSYLQGIGPGSGAVAAPPKNTGADVSPDLLAEVREELGDAVLIGLGSEQVETLKRFYFGGEEFVNFNAAKSLGAPWNEIDSDHSFETKEFHLQNGPNGDSQTLVLDTKDDSIVLSTTNSTSGPFAGTADIENLWLTADGNVRRQRFFVPLTAGTK